MLHELRPFKKCLSVFMLLKLQFLNATDDLDEMLASTILVALG